MSTVLPFGNLDYAEQYFIDRGNELLAVAGTPWAFAGGTCLIEYIAKMINGGTADQFAFIDFIRNHMPQYGHFLYKTSNSRRQRTGFDTTTQDLPEQIYYILRCGLLHRFSLIPTATEISNGGRPRSVVMSHHPGATQGHLSHYSNGSDVVDAAFLVSQDFIADIQQAVRNVFSDAGNHGNITHCLTTTPPIYLF